MRHMFALVIHWTGLLALLILLFGAVLVYRDAARRYPPGSLAPLVWFFVALILGPLGWLLYLVLRPPFRR